MSKLQNLRSRSLAVIAAASLPVLSFAQTADPFMDAVTDMRETVTTYGGALVGLAAVGVVFWVAIKYVKKIRGAA